MRNNGKMTCLYSAVQSDKIQMQLQSSRWQLYLMLLSPGSKLVNVLSQMDLKCFDHARSWRKSCLPSRPRFGHQWRRTNNANAMSLALQEMVRLSSPKLHFTPLQLLFVFLELRRFCFRYSIHFIGYFSTFPVMAPSLSAVSGL